MTRLTLAAALLVSLGACVPHVSHEHDRAPGRGYDRGGPPAHAPAHGYRRHHHGHDLDFDNRLGVYLVVGSPGFYFWDDFYWRLRDGFWVRASAFNGPWVVIDDSYRQLPPGLGKKHGYGKNHGKSKNKSEEKTKGKEKKKH